MQPVLCVIGTRPEAVKMAPVIRALGSDCRVALTGQHDEIVDEVLGVFGIKPNYDLAIIRPGKSLHQIGADCLVGLKSIIEDCQPAALLMQGDTASTTFGALAGFMAGVPVGHVEAGLRSGDRQAPFPEEVLRQVVSKTADWHFAPTAAAADNLLREGISQDVYITGNTVVDALQYAWQIEHWIENADLYAAIHSGCKLVLLTMHRRENQGRPMRRALEAVKRLADEREDIRVLYPVHPNPAVRRVAEDVLAGHPRIRLTKPLGYLDMIAAMEHASLILTDSGGIQEEAPSFGCPVVVLRDVTERPEAVEAGCARLAGCWAEKILPAAAEALDGRWRPTAVNLFGDGKAGLRIARIIHASLQS